MSNKIDEHLYEGSSLNIFNLVVNNVFFRNKVAFFRKSQWNYEKRLTTIAILVNTAYTTKSMAAIGSSASGKRPIKESCINESEQRHL